MKILCSFVLSFFLVSNVWAKPITAIDIHFWHAMTGQLGRVLNQLVTQFNQSQDRYRIVPIYKGNYAETLTVTVAAFRGRQHPALVQIYEVGTATMLHPPGVIVPVHQLRTAGGEKVPTDMIMPAIRAYYSDRQNRLLAMPLNASSAVLYYNKQQFQQAGIENEKPGATWPQMATISERLLKAGTTCGFTTAWPSWIQLEEFSAWHNVAIADAENGFGGTKARMQINNPVVLNHLAHLAKWQQRSIFRYGGRNNDATSLFTSGKCAMLMQSSGALNSLQAMSDFPVGVAPLPYWPEVKGAPQNTIIGGAAVWALSGHPPEVYQGIAAFFKFLLETEVQVKWQQLTGYIPLTDKAYQLSLEQGFYDHNPGAKVALESLRNKAPTPFSRGIRLGNYVMIRSLNNAAIEAIVSGMKTPQRALRELNAMNNHVLQQFDNNTRQRGSS